MASLSLPIILSWGYSVLIHSVFLFLSFHLQQKQTVGEVKQRDGKSVFAPKNKLTLSEGSTTQSTCVVAHSRSRAKVWFIFWNYQDESILKMKSTSSSKWRALIKVFDKDQKCLSPFIEFIAFFCQSSSTGPGFPENSWFFRGALKKIVQRNQSINPFQSLMQLPPPSQSDPSLHVYQQHKFSALVWILPLTCDTSGTLLWSSSSHLISIPLLFPLFLGS